MAITDLTNTKWYFNETIQIRNDSFYIKFTTNGKQAIFIEFQSWANIMSYHIPSESTQIFEVYDSGGWMINNSPYRTIEITGGTDVSNTDLITWLQNNATQLPTQTPKEQYQEKLTELANAINEKTGGTSPLSVSDMVSAVNSIQVGGSVIEVATENDLPTTATDGTIAIITGGGN